MSSDLPAPVQAAQHRARRVPAAIRYPLIFGAFALTFYWVFTESGLYIRVARQIADAQGRYSGKVAFLLTLVATMIPAGIAVHLLAFLFPIKPKPESQP